MISLPVCRCHQPVWDISLLSRIVLIRYIPPTLKSDLMITNLQRTSKLYKQVFAIAHEVLLKFLNKTDSGTYLPFVSTSPAMFELNMSVLSLGDFSPALQIVYRKNQTLLSCLLQHVAFAVTCNNSVFSKTAPNAYLNPSSTELMKQFDIDGTKVGTLQDLIVSEVHYVAFKRVYSRNLLLLFQDMHDHFPGDIS